MRPANVFLIMELSNSRISHGPLRLFRILFPGQSQPFFVQHYDTSRFLTQIRFADKGEERYNKVTGNRSAS